MATDFTAAQLSPLGAEWAAIQAQANARIEGFKPDKAFEEDFALLTAGRISHEEFVRRSHAAVAAERTKAAGESP